MVRHASLFSQLIAFFNRNKFTNLVLEHKTERHSKGFKSWDQFVAMLFCQVAQAKSLREISGGLMLLIKFFQLKSKFEWSLSNLVFNFETSPLIDGGLRI